MFDWLEAGARLTVSGLSLVFLVLALLWAVMALLLRLERPVPVPSAPADVDAAASGSIDPALLAAILMAVRAHVDAGRWHPARRRGGGQSRWASAGRERQTQHWPVGRRG